MNTYITTLLASVGLALVVASTAVAQGTPVHPTDPNAVFLGSFYATISVNGGTSNSNSGNTMTMTASEECELKVLVNVWRTSTGQIDYVLDASSVQYVGNCDGVNLSVSDVFSRLSREALRMGIQNGYSPCNTNCDSVTYSRAYAALCVRRTGQGEQTKYEPCDMTSYCYREYSYCCPNGSSQPQITEVPRNGDECSAGMPGSCQTTCGPTSGDSLQ